MSNNIHDFTKSYCKGNCIQPNIFNNKSVFKVNQENGSKVGYTILNPSVLSGDKLDATIKSYRDPRLYNQGGTWLQLDKQPLNFSTNLSTLNTDNSFNNYGKRYNSYCDINTGGYLYYINKEEEKVFSDTLFSNKSISVGTMYKDPMGSIKPYYERIPIENYNPIDNQFDETPDYCLSFIRDTQFQREDILALQMSKRNTQRYELVLNK